MHMCGQPHFRGGCCVLSSPWWKRWRSPAVTSIAQRIKPSLASARPSHLSGACPQRSSITMSLIDAWGRTVFPTIHTEGVCIIGSSLLGTFPPIPLSVACTQAEIHDGWWLAKGCRENTGFPVLRSEAGALRPRLSPRPCNCTTQKDWCRKFIAKEQAFHFERCWMLVRFYFKFLVKFSLVATEINFMVI